MVNATYFADDGGWFYRFGEGSKVGPFPGFSAALAHRQGVDAPSTEELGQGGAVGSARQAHNLKVVGSNPTPAPIDAESEQKPGEAAHVPAPSPQPSPRRIITPEAKAFANWRERNAQ